MAKINREVIHSDEAPKPIGPYSIGIRASGLVFASGSAGIDPSTGELVPGGIEAETRQTLENLKSILEAGGASLKSVVKTTVFLRDMAEFPKMNAVYREYFPVDSPARTTVQAAALPKSAAVEIDAIALAEDSQ